MKKWPLLILLLLVPPTDLSATVYSYGLDKNLYTSDFLIGNVVVSVIFVESDGSVDPNIENWSSERQSQVLSQIMSGLDWWTHQNTRSPLTFVYDIKTITSKYEPITRPYYDEALWIAEIMSKMGYTGSRFTSTRNYVNTLRTQYNADWGFVIFVLDSLVDSNGKLADGYFAYAYLGGPYMVMTYDNNGYGISNMNVVVAHETGHIFHALDEYAGASSPNAYSSGYFPTINGNHVYSSLANDPNSVMRGGIRWGLDNWARQMVGWRDTNNNNQDDIFDSAPMLTMSQQAQSAPEGETSYSGLAKVRVCPRQNNLNGYGFTVDTIAKVEFRIPGQEWAVAEPTSGNFGDPEVTFKIKISPHQDVASQTIISAADIDVRVITTYSGQIGTQGGGSGSGILTAAHAYPNPYKPNSNPGKSEVTFSHLIPGTKVQIFTTAGEPIFEGTTETTTLDWADANTTASGVYYFLISDGSGNVKRGKLAIIR